MRAEGGRILCIDGARGLTIRKDFPARHASKLYVGRPPWWKLERFGARCVAPLPKHCMIYRLDLAKFSWSCELVWGI